MSSLDDFEKVVRTGVVKDGHCASCNGEAQQIDRTWWHVAASCTDYDGQRFVEGPAPDA